MLSILIPVYNFNIIPLVKNLVQQLVKADISFEIICIDDASVNKEIQKRNKIVSEFQNCNYEILSVNIGRSKIRNYLAKKARYENLIFLDADVLPINNEFTQNYIKALEVSSIIFGGISYPKLSAKYKGVLHYKYGKNREAVSYKKRKKYTNQFTSANFAIKKSLFNEIKFDEAIKTYGYEDLLFSKNILSKNNKIAQIDNDVIHYGIIENNHNFILKEHESLQTLNQLYKNKSLDENNVKLLYYYSILKKVGVKNIFAKFYKVSKKVLLKNLTSNKPSLLVFDLYKLGYFISTEN